MRLVMIASPYHDGFGLGEQAELVGYLPAWLALRGFSVTVLEPLFRPIVDIDRLQQLPTTLPVRREQVALEFNFFEQPQLSAGVRRLYVDEPDLFDWNELCRMESKNSYATYLPAFALWAQVALASLSRLQLECDWLHLHGWANGLVPAYAKAAVSINPELALAPLPTPMPKLLFTFYQVSQLSLFLEDRWPATGLAEAFRHQLATTDEEQQALVDLNAAGVLSADRLTTTSTAYLEELRHPDAPWLWSQQHSEHLQSVTPILTGIDLEAWDANRDLSLPCRFGTTDWQAGKAVCKLELRRKLRLPEEIQGPLLVFVGELSENRGCPHLIDLADELFAFDVQLFIVGEGDADMEKSLTMLADVHPGRLVTRIQSDQNLFRLALAAADLQLLPSEWESAAQWALRGMRYGAVPVARATGAHRDVIVDATPTNLAAGTANGFLYRSANATALMAALRKVFLWMQKPDLWQTVVRAGMSHTHSINQTAAAYEQIYRSATTTGVSQLS